MTRRAFAFLMSAVIGVFLGSTDLRAQSLPYRLDTVSAWGGAVNAFQKVKNIGYCGSGQRFVVLDMSNEANIHEIGSINLHTTVQDFVVRGSYAYVTCEENPYRFSVLDVSVPTAPRLIWTETDPCVRTIQVKRIQVNGNVAYLRQSNRVWAYDLSNPTHPVAIPTGSAGSCPVGYNVTFGTPGTPTHTTPEALEIVGGYAYTVGYCPSEAVNDRNYLSVFSLNPLDPIHPTFVGSVMIPDSWYSDAKSHLAIESGRAVIKTMNTNGDHIVRFADVSVPSSPVITGGYDDVYFAHGVALRGNLAFVADWMFTSEYVIPRPASLLRLKGLAVLDITNPASPVLVATYNTNHSSIREVRVSGNRAYLFCDGQGLEVLDISGLSQQQPPVRIGGYFSPSAFRHQTKVGSRLYVADEWNGFVILDVSNPAVTPSVIGVYRSPESVIVQSHWTVQVRDNWAYVSGHHIGIEVVDISNPGAPVRSYLYREPYEEFGMEGIELDGNVLHASYLASPVPLPEGERRYANFDISNPPALTKIGELMQATGLPLPGPPYVPKAPYYYRRMATRLGITFCVPGHGAGDNARIDNRVPQSPVLVTNAWDPWGGRDLEMVGNRLYATSMTDEQLYIVDVTDPINPAVLGTMSARIREAVGEAEGRVYVSSFDPQTPSLRPGIRALDVSNPASPRVLAYSPAQEVIDLVAEGDLVFAVFADSSFLGGAHRRGGVVIQQFYCGANCDRSTAAPVLTANDFQCFLNRFAARDPYANCDGSTVAPTLTANDFQCFLNAFAAGCN